MIDCYVVYESDLYISHWLVKKKRKFFKDKTMAKFQVYNNLETTEEAYKRDVKPYLERLTNEQCDGK